MRLPLNYYSCIIVMEDIHIDEHDVELYIYDLSQGMAKSLSSIFLDGEMIDGIWHTSIVVYNREYFFGSEGIIYTFPNGTILGNNHSSILMGQTQIPLDIIENYIQELSKGTFRLYSYNLFNNNCNNFSNEFSIFLTGNPIPCYITSLPQKFLNTPIGKMIVPIIENMSIGAKQQNTNFDKFIHPTKGNTKITHCPNFTNPPIVQSLDESLTNKYEEFEKVEKCECSKLFSSKLKKTITPMEMLKNYIKSDGPSAILNKKKTLEESTIVKKNFTERKRSNTLPGISSEHTIVNLSEKDENKINDFQAPKNNFNELRKSIADSPKESLLFITDVEPIIHYNIEIKSCFAVIKRMDLKPTDYDLLMEVYDFLKNEITEWSLSWLHVKLICNLIIQSENTEETCVANMLCLALSIPDFITTVIYDKEEHFRNLIFKWQSLPQNYYLILCLCICNFLAHKDSLNKVFEKQVSNMKMVDFLNYCLNIDDPLVNIAALHAYTNILRSNKAGSILAGVIGTALIDLALKKKAELKDCVYLWYCLACCISLNSKLIVLAQSPTFKNVDEADSGIVLYYKEIIKRRIS